MCLYVYRAASAPPSSGCGLGVVWSPPSEDRLDSALLLLADRPPSAEAVESQARQSIDGRSVKYKITRLQDRFEPDKTEPIEPIS
jgi:hypothetical protein